MSPLRLTCAHSAFPMLSLDAAFTVIRDLGFHAVDVCVFEGYQQLPPEEVLAGPDAAAAAVSERLRAHGLVASDVFAIVGDSFRALALNHPDAAVRAESRRRFEGFVAFAAALGAPGITILPGTEFEGVPAADSMSLAADELAWRAQIAATAGLRLSWEPHFESIAETPGRALDLVRRATGSDLALDPSHFAYQGIDMAELDPLLPHTGHFHVRQGAPGAMQTRMAEGTIDFAALAERLLATGYDGYFSVEYQWDPEWLDFTHVDCIAETALARKLLLGIGQHGA